MRVCVRARAAEQGQTVSSWRRESACKDRAERNPRAASARQGRPDEPVNDDRNQTVRRARQVSPRSRSSECVLNVTMTSGDVTRLLSRFTRKFVEKGLNCGRDIYSVYLGQGGMCKNRLSFGNERAGEH